LLGGSIVSNSNLGVPLREVYWNVLIHQSILELR
jgi:hypothetical protein